MLQIWLILKPSLSGQSLLKPPLSAALSMTCWMMPGVKGFLPSFSRQLALFKSYIVLLSSMISSKVEPFLHCLIAKLQNVQRTFFRSPYTTPLCSLIIDSIYSEFASFQRQDIHKHSKVKNAQIQQYKHFQVTGTSLEHLNILSKTSANSEQQRLQTYFNTLVTWKATIIGKIMARMLSTTNWIALTQEPLSFLWHFCDSSINSTFVRLHPHLRPCSLLEFPVAQR